MPIIRGSTVVLILLYVCRRGPGQEYVKSALGEVVQNIMSYDKSLEIDPLKVGVLCVCVCMCVHNRAQYMMQKFQILFVRWEISPNIRYFMR